MFEKMSEFISVRLEQMHSRRVLCASAITNVIKTAISQRRINLDIFNNLKMFVFNCRITYTNMYCDLSTMDSDTASKITHRDLLDLLEENRPPITIGHQYLPSCWVTSVLRLYT